MSFLEAATVKMKAKASVDAREVRPKTKGWPQQSDGRLTNDEDVNIKREAKTGDGKRKSRQETPDKKPQNEGYRFKK